MMNQGNTTPTLKGIDPNTPRTWRTYVDYEVRYFPYRGGSVEFTHRKKGEQDGRITCQTNHGLVTRTIQSLVDLDGVPDLETFKVLWGVQRKWEEEGYSCEKYTPGTPGNDVRDTLSGLFKDHLFDIPGDIFRWFLTEEIFTSSPPKDDPNWSYPFTFMTILMVKHPSLPSDVIDFIVKLDKKSDPTTETKGGRLYTFLTDNPSLTEDHLLGIVRNGTRVSDLEECVKHPNSTQEVLSEVFHKTKSDKLKNSILRKMYERGLIKV